MTFDLDATHRPDAYKILSSLVTPRPIAWVTSLNEDGSVNAAPFSFFNVFGSNPPLVAFAPGNKEPGLPKDTARNIRSQREFVINLEDEAVLESMIATAAPLPYGQSELDSLGLTLASSEAIQTPRIAEAPAALECTEHSCIEVGNNRMILGIVHRVHAREGLFDGDSTRLHAEAYAPIGRMASPNFYCRTNQLFTKP